MITRDFWTAGQNGVGGTADCVEGDVMQVTRLKKSGVTNRLDGLWRVGTDSWIR